MDTNRHSAIYQNIAGNTLKRNMRRSLNAAKIQLMNKSGSACLKEKVTSLGMTKMVSTFTC